MTLYGRTGEGLESGGGAKLRGVSVSPYFIPPSTSGVSVAPSLVVTPDLKHPSSIIYVITYIIYLSLAAQLVVGHVGISIR